MKKCLIISLILAGSLVLAPSFAPPVVVSAQETGQTAVSEEEPSVLANIGRGIAAVWEAVTDWFRGLVRFFTGERDPKARGECDSISDCDAGLTCLNACPEDDPDCGVFTKTCVSREGIIEIQPEFTPCDANDLCEEGSFCTRTCPEGAACETTHRCLPLEAGAGSCQTDAACLEICGERDFPSAALGGWEASCTEGSCHCLFREIDPDLPVAACPDNDRNIVCPQGTSPACTAADGPLRLTCLTAPEFGGQCLNDAACQNVRCAEGSTPFCADDDRCRCRRVQEEVVSCSADTDCSGLSCADGEPSICREGACVCEQVTAEEADLSCSADADCSGVSCQEGFDPACVDGSCACQRTREDAPVECTTVEDCGGVSCPEDFEKTCLDDVCACTRTVIE